MKIKDITTPNFLLNLDVLEKNIKNYQYLAELNGISLFPMLKTHKSSEITKLQIDMGACGVLVGTLDEAEKVIITSGVKKIMLAYPVVGKNNLKRVIQLNKKCELFVAFDNVLQGEELSSMLDENDSINYQIIINSGLNRFGVKPFEALSLYNSLAKFKNLKIKGISTHSGHVYGISSKNEISNIANEEITSMKKTKELFDKNKIQLDFIASGTTPTFKEVLTSNIITVLRPGNYVFYDAIQVGLGVAKEEDCALTVLTTIISNPQKNIYIIDCGSKCLGLDQGAHGNSLIKGFGIVKGYPQLEIISLSEEVGKIKVKDNCNLKIGDRIEIIPNHSCSSANMTSNLLGYRSETIEKIISVDMRGNSKKWNLN